MSAKVKKGAERFNVTYELSCDFEFSLLTLSTGKRVNRVKRTPVLTIPEGNDGNLLCERAARHGARCTGHVHKSTIIRGGLHLRRPCKRPRAKLDLDILGGVDCNDGPCPANALEDKKTVSVAGC